MRQATSPPFGTVLLSLESEGAAPHEVLDPSQAHDFCLLYSKANRIGTHLGLFYTVPVGPFPLHFTIKTVP